MNYFKKKEKNLFKMKIASWMKPLRKAKSIEFKNLC